MEGNGDEILSEKSQAKNVKEFLFTHYRGITHVMYLERDNWKEL